MSKQIILLFILIATGFSGQTSFAQSLSSSQEEPSDSLLEMAKFKDIRHRQYNVPVHRREDVGLKRHGDDEHHEGLHFAHPLFTESVSPDTKFRFDYTYRNLTGDLTRNGLVLGGEYAFYRSFSIEVGIPYEFLDPETGNSRSRIGNTEISFKFANYAFEDSGLLLGYGLEFGLPSGNDRAGIGSDHIFELAPFLNIGLKKDRFEWVGFATFGIPTNQDPGQDIETELELNASVLYHISNRWQGLVELNGEGTLSGPGAGEESAWFLSPGFKVAPLQNEHLKAGLGAQIPLSKDSEQNLGLIGSIFYHF